MLHERTIRGIRWGTDDPDEGFWVMLEGGPLKCVDCDGVIKVDASPRIGEKVSSKALAAFWGEERNHAFKCPRCRGHLVALQ